MSELRKVIAVDFDGCLCHNVFPEIGAPHWDVIAKARQEQRDGAGLILWTCRVRDAVAACAQWGLEFDAVNESLPEWIEAFGNNTRKVGATEYWDDRAVPVRDGYLCNENGGGRIGEKGTKEYIPIVTDDPLDNVSAALNLVYIKDQKTWIRGYGPAPDFEDVDLDTATRDILKKIHPGCGFEGSGG